jgi:hypothetical protein
MLEQLRYELQNRAKVVHIAGINKIDAESTQGDLADECSFPLLQDTEEENAWALMEGRKDDFYIYDSEGKLAVHLPARGDVTTDLSSPTGYANLRDALMYVE